MRELADLHYPRAKRIRVVLDNLSTHSPGALYHTFPPDGPIAYSLCLFHRRFKSEVQQGSIDGMAE